MHVIANEQELLAHVGTDLPAVRHLLAFAPHPDDEVFGCGGLLARMADTGIQLTVIVATDGSAGGDDAGGDLIETRASESRAAARVLGLPEPIFWGVPDRGLIYGEALIERIMAAITATEADCVLLPSPIEVHPDHQALSLAGAEALRRLGGERQIIFYEVNTPLQNPNLLIDISALTDKKREAMRCFASQLAELPYDSRMEGLSRFRSYFLGPQSTAAEAFMATTPAAIELGLAPLFSGVPAHRQRLGFAADIDDLPLVSIIIRSMDRPTLGRALDSLALQTWPNLEVVVVNAKGGNHAPLEECCGRFPLRLVNQEGPPLPRSMAANVGLENCRGRYLGFLDDDDSLDPDHVQHLVAALGGSTGTGLAYSGVRGVNDCGGDPSVLLEFKDPGVSFTRLLLGNLIPIHAVLFSKELLAQGAGFDEKLDLYEDWDFWLQLTRRTTPLFVNRTTASYYTGGSSAVGLGADDTSLKQQAREALFAKWLPLLTPAEFGAVGELHHRTLQQLNAERDQQLAEKGQQLAEKGQQLAERGQQLAEKDQQLAEKDQQLACLYASRSWRITRPLRWGTNVMRGIRNVLAGQSEKIRASGGVGAATIKAGKVLCAEGPAGIRNRMRAGHERTQGQFCYQEWLKLHDAAAEGELGRWLAEKGQCATAPVISVVMPVYNPEPCWLEEAIESVRSQRYPRWELCIADDASTNPEISPILHRYAAEDARIKVCYRTENGHISVASNSALDLATGAYVCFLDHDDQLHPDALLELAVALSQQPDADLLYTDEDKLSPAGERCLPFFKPDWSPHLAISQAYLGHLVCYRRSLLQELGGLTAEMAGAQDYDLWLRASLKARTITHIPRVLYHWRMHAGSTAMVADAKPYAHEVGRRAVAAYLQQRYPAMQLAAVEGASLFTYAARFELPQNLLVSIIIPTRNGLHLLQPCIESIQARSSWRQFELIIVDNGSDDPKTREYLQQLQADEPAVHVVTEDVPFNWSKLNNSAVRQARGDVFIFLNNDTQVITPDWIQHLAGYALLPDVGVAGALLLFEDGTIQHSGVVVGMGGWADHVFRTTPATHDASGPFVSPVLTRDVLAVTGACMAVSRARFEELGGFDESFIICGSDVELGLRAHHKGLYNVLCGEARLYHLESKTRTPAIPEQDFSQSAEKYEPYRTQQPDPFYNPNLSLATTAPALKGA